jgi:hypothetical protein
MILILWANERLKKIKIDFSKNKQIIQTNENKNKSLFFSFFPFF